MSDDVLTVRTPALVLFFDLRNGTVTITAHPKGPPLAPVQLSLGAFEDLLRAGLALHEKERTR